MSWRPSDWKEHLGIIMVNDNLSNLECFKQGIEAGADALWEALKEKEDTRYYGVGEIEEICLETDEAGWLVFIEDDKGEQK